MDKLNIKLGRYAGIDLTFHYTATILFVFVLLFRGIDSLLFLAGIFFMVILHEFGHALAAQKYHIKTKGITITILGGLATLEKIPKDPKKELYITIAGPLVNVVIIAAMYTGHALSELLGLPHYHGGISSMIVVMNLILVVFNLIPAYPMDGGRIYRALLCLILKDHLKATRMAMHASFVFGACFICLGIYLFNFNLIIIGILAPLASLFEFRQLKKNKVNYNFPSHGGPPSLPWQLDE